MTVHLVVLARDSIVESRYSEELRSAARKLDGTQIHLLPSSEADSEGLAQVILVDSGIKDLPKVLESLPRKGRAVFLIVDEGQRTPDALFEGKVDDVLVHPFRPLELQSRLFHYQQLLMWDEVSRLNASFKELLDRLREDLKLAERLQKGRLPQRFPDIKGVKVSSRYLAGMRSGGDYFDLAESKDGGTLSMVLSDSSSYGLSNSLLSILMRVAMKLSGGEVRSSAETVQKIHEELRLTLGEKDRLSLFYGVVSRKDYRLRFLNLGSSSAFYAGPTGGFTALPSQGGAITQTSNLTPSEEGAVTLEPKGRLVLVSDGFVEAAGDTGQVCKLLDQYREKEPADWLNEMVFRVKSKFEAPDDMPAQDCTAITFDIDARVLRLA